MQSSGDSKESERVVNRNSGSWMRIRTQWWLLGLNCPRNQSIKRKTKRINSNNTLKSVWICPPEPIGECKSENSDPTWPLIDYRQAFLLKTRGVVREYESEGKRLQEKSERKSTVLGCPQTLGATGISQWQIDTIRSARPSVPGPIGECRSEQMYRPHLSSNRSRQRSLVPSMNLINVKKEINVLIKLSRQVRSGNAAAVISVELRIELCRERNSAENKLTCAGNKNQAIKLESVDV